MAIAVKLHLMSDTRVLKTVTVSSSVEESFVELMQYLLPIVREYVPAPSDLTDDVRTVMLRDVNRAIKHPLDRHTVTDFHTGDPAAFHSTYSVVYHETR